MASERPEERPRRVQEHPGPLQPVPHGQDHHTGQDQEPQQLHL